MTPSTKPATDTVEPVKTFTQTEIDVHLAKFVATATERYKRPPRRASACVVGGKIRCTLDFTARDY